MTPSIWIQEANSGSLIMRLRRASGSANDSGMRAVRNHTITFDFCGPSTFVKLLAKAMWQRVLLM